MSRASIVYDNILTILSG